MILNGIIDFINNTPLIELKNIYKGKGKLFAKMEFIQPGGSIKDRTALQIIKDAYSDKKLVDGQPVVEMTSGNMGAGLAVVCKACGNPFTAVMSEGNSSERIKILKALGAEVILTPQVDGEKGMVTGKDIEKATEKAKEIAFEKKAFYVDQFNNPSSIRAHYFSTGPEISEDLNNKVDVFISVVGSGGTFIGTSKYLKEINNKVYCIAVEPENAAIIKSGKIIDPKQVKLTEQFDTIDQIVTELNKFIDGTGYGLVPPHWDSRFCDEIITVKDDEVIKTTKELASLEGLFVGFSSGANVLAALKYLKNVNVDLNVVTILCDTGYKYSYL